MPDITMCGSEKCKKKDICYRKNATPSKHWQSYSDFTDQCKEEDYIMFMVIFEAITELDKGAKDNRV